MNALHYNVLLDDLCEVGFFSFTRKRSIGNFSGFLGIQSPIEVFSYLNAKSRFYCFVVKNEAWHFEIIDIS